MQGEGKGAARGAPYGSTPWPVRRRPVQTAAVLAVPATGLRPGLLLAPAPACLAAWPPLAGAALRPTGGPWNGGSGEADECWMGGGPQPAATGDGEAERRRRRRGRAREGR